MKILLISASIETESREPTIQTNSVSSGWLLA